MKRTILLFGLFAAVDVLAQTTPPASPTARTVTLDTPGNPTKAVQVAVVLPDGYAPATSDTQKHRAWKSGTTNVTLWAECEDCKDVEKNWQKALANVAAFEERLNKTPAPKGAARKIETIEKETTANVSFVTLKITVEGQPNNSELRGTCVMRPPNAIYNLRLSIMSREPITKPVADNFRAACKGLAVEAPKT